MNSFLARECPNPSWFVAHGSWLMTFRIGNEESNFEEDTGRRTEVKTNSKNHYNNAGPKPSLPRRCPVCLFTCLPPRPAPSVCLLAFPRAASLPPACCPGCWLPCHAFPLARFLARHDTVNFSLGCVIFLFSFSFSGIHPCTNTELGLDQLQHECG